jgi:RNA polymerase sigma factor (sigma-70 family)
MKAGTGAPPFGRLIDEHATVVAAYLRGMLRAADAEDALQETYLAAYRAIDRFDGRNPRAWLLTIARRKAIDLTRAEGRSPGELPDPDEVPGEVPGEDHREVWAAVAGLPPKQREAVVLRFAADLRYREIAIAMETSEAAARRNVHEGISKLRQSSEIEEVRR